MPPPQSPPAAERRESGTAMGKLAFLFPGQASQYPGMGRDLAEKFPESRAVFDEADAALGFSISKLCFEGTEEELKLTENTQPAILTVSLAAYRALGSAGYRRRILPRGTAWENIRRWWRRARSSFRGGEAGAPARAIHAGSGAGGRRGDGRDSGACAGGGGGNLQEGGGWRSGFAGESEFTGADGDLRALRRR